MVRQIFKNRVVAAAGPLPVQLTVDNLKRWTRMRREISQRALTRGSRIFSA